MKSQKNKTYKYIPVDFIVNLGKDAIDDHNVGIANGIWYVLAKWRDRFIYLLDNNKVDVLIPASYIKALIKALKNRQSDTDISFTINTLESLIDHYEQKYLQN